MATLKDVLEVQRSVHLQTRLFGVVDGFSEEYLELLREVGRVFCAESRCTSEEAQNLPTDTILGPRAQKEFEILKAFLAEQRALASRG